jgi:hypothetical protein
LFEYKRKIRELEVRHHLMHQYYKTITYFVNER